MDTSVWFNLTKQRLDYYTCPIGIKPQRKPYYFLFSWPCVMNDFRKGLHAKKISASFTTSLIEASSVSVQFMSNNLKGIGDATASRPLR